MKFTKTSLTQWFGHQCERQLALSLWTDNEQKADAAAGSSGEGIPHRQLLAGIYEMSKAGDEWQAEKMGDLMTAFGQAKVLGTPSPNGIVRNSPTDISTARFAPSDLAALLPTAKAGDFLVESALDAWNTAFETTWQLAWAPALPLQWGSIRPDLIEVAAPGRFNTGLTATGDLIDLNGDPRLVLRVIDAKLSSEPGRGYYAEVTYYSLALAAWLVEHGLDQQFVVSAQPALWPGSHGQSAVRKAAASGGSLTDALDEDLEECPVDVFIPEVIRFLTTVLPRVAADARTGPTLFALPHHIRQSCASCDYIGQNYPNVTPQPGQASAPHPNHCEPRAATGDDVSRIPYLSRGSTVVLRDAGVGTTTAAAARASIDPCFDDHHSLRAGREVIPARAAALGGGPTGIGQQGATSAALPKYADLRIYVTADFDPTSAITLAFGLSTAFFPSKFGAGKNAQPRFIRTQVFHPTSRSILDERAELSLFLQAIAGEIDAAQQIDPKATVQVYVWDDLTFDHLTRVVGRHLDWLLVQAASGAKKGAHNIAWLFPPEQVMGTALTAKNPAVSVLGDAVRGLLATDQPHVYTLLATAAVYHHSGFNVSRLWTPPYWASELSDQIPGERAFDLWNHRSRPNLSHATLIKNLTRTVEARHYALATIARQLSDDLKPNLRTAPMCKQLAPPGFVPKASMLGSLLHAYSKLNHAYQWQENYRSRSMAPVEREARFLSVLCDPELKGAARAAAASALGITTTNDTMIFPVRPGSTEAKISKDDFTVAIGPLDEVGLLDKSLYGLVKKHSLDNESWWNNKKPWLNMPGSTIADALGVTIKAFDRHAKLIAVELSHGELVRGLQAGGAVDLTGDCVIDPLSNDFLSKRIADAVVAIGNPPKAQAQTNSIRAALGVTTKGPGASSTLPAEDLLWDPTILEQAVVARNTAALEPLVRTSIGAPDLNPHQWDAWRHALTRRLTLIWGPPGTGKSRTVGAILDGLAIDAANNGTRLRILLTAQTWTAVDNVLEPFHGRNPNVTTFRVRSAVAGPPTGPLAAIDMVSNDQSDRDTVLDELDTATGPVVVAGTPQQIQRLVKDAGRSCAAPTFDVIIVDEAGQAEVGTSILAFALLAKDGQVVVAGDPLQLPPIHQVEPPPDLAHLVGSVYSFFSEQYGVPSEELLINYRSNQEIVDLSRHAGYPPGFVANNPGLRLPLTVSPGSTPVGWPASLTRDPVFDDIIDPAKPVVCLTYRDGTAGQWNQFEADATVALATLLADGLAAQASTQPPGWLWDKAIGIVTPHRAQRALIVSGLAAAFPAEPAGRFDSVVDTVERFQGQERDVILASYAVGDPDTIATEEEFLHSLNRFNVLATRAKSKVIVLVSDELLAHLAVDIEVIRSSRLLKSFATTFCQANSPAAFTHRPSGKPSRAVDASVRWHV